MKRHPFFDLAFGCLLAAAVASAAAQEPAGPPQPVRFSRLGLPYGLRQYASEAWGVVGVDVVNPQDQPANVLAAFGFSRDPALQFARRIEVPAQAIRRTWVPVKLPRVPPSQISIPCTGMLIDDRSGSEVVLRRDYEEVQHSMLLRVNQDKPMTGAFLEESDWVSDDVDYAYEAVIAMRTARGYQRSLALISDRDLPPRREVFDALDQVVLWNDLFAADVAILSVLRSWLNDGGELWVMLDRVDFRGLEQLLGNTFTCQLVDRVTLDKVAIQDAEPLPAAGPEPAVEYERPLDLARVLVTGMKVTHTVQGWPAAFWRPVGRGRVMFTAVGAEAWIRPATAVRPRWDPHRMTDFSPTRQLESLPMLQMRNPPLGQPSLFRSYLSERIGYRIASRGPVSAVLGLFCAALLLAGVVLARRKRLEHLAWIAPGLALAAAVPLAGLGLRSQRSVPAMVGEAQFVEVSDGGDQLTANGMLAFYDPQSTGEAIGARAGGRFELEGTAAAGSTRRMVWSDVDCWQWENLRPSTGLRTATFDWSGDLPQGLAVHGTFSAEGFTAHWTDSTMSLADAVIAIPGQPSLSVHADGPRLAAGPRDVLAPRRYVSGGWLSDEQRRRQAVIEKMLTPRAGFVRHLLRPTLFGWGDAVEMGFQFPRHEQRVGTALWAIPVSIDRPPAGTPVVVPSPFVPFRVTNRPTGEGASPLYDYRTGVWVASQKPSEMWLRFQTPEAVLPLQLQRARLTLQITAPSRTVAILRYVDSRKQQVQQVRNPIGRIERTFQDAELPPLDARGGLLVGINVGSAAEAGSQLERKPWKIELAQLEIEGVVLPETRE